MKLQKIKHKLIHVIFMLGIYFINNTWVLQFYFNGDLKNGSNTRKRHMHDSCDKYICQKCCIFLNWR